MLIEQQRNEPWLWVDHACLGKGRCVRALREFQIDEFVIEYKGLPLIGSGQSLILILLILLIDLRSDCDSDYAGLTKLSFVYSGCKILILC
jgi:hypothetical protein